jgi:cobalamin biosynthesis protein CobD/CbiB
MGISDTLKNMFGKGKQAAAEHPDQAKGMVDKAANKADDMTGHKQTSNIDKGANMAKDDIDKYGKQND